MTREVYLIIYHSPLFPAHWAFWIPSADNAKIGKKLHVFGDAAKGFEHEFQRNYSTAGTQRKHSLVLLTNVEDNHIVDVPGDGSQSSDKTAADDIERQALVIPAPAKSLNPSGNGAKKKVQIWNCQTWLHQLVEALVTAKIFPNSAITVLNDAAKN